MPQNRRPPGWLVDDPNWEGSTLAERRNAQNTYDLLVEQEKANELAKEKIKQDRENAEIKAKAIRQAEEDKFLYQAYLQSKQQSFEEEQRKLKLCDDLGVDYKDLKKFDYFLGLTNKGITTEIETIETEITTADKQLNNLKNNTPENKYDTTKLLNAKSRLQKEMNNLRNSGLLKKMFNGKEIKEKLEDYQEGINHIERQIKELEQEYETNKDSLNIKYNNDIESLNNKIKELKDKKEKLEYENEEYMKNKHKDFMNFRITHYNYEIEMLFRKLDLSILLALDKLYEQQNNISIEECIKEEGNIKDYIQYIRKCIRNL